MWEVTASVEQPDGTMDIAQRWHLKTDKEAKALVAKVEKKLGAAETYLEANLMTVSGHTLDRSGMAVATSVNLERCFFEDPDYFPI